MSGKKRKATSAAKVIKSLCQRKIDAARKKAEKEQNEKIGPRRRIALALAKAIQESRECHNGHGVKHAFDDYEQLAFFCWDEAKVIMQKAGLR